MTENKYGKLHEFILWLDSIRLRHLKGLIGKNLVMGICGEEDVG